MWEHERRLLRDVVDQWHGDEPGLDELVEEVSSRLWAQDPPAHSLDASPV
jgi:hypothetical protein